jgi:hypothetical protein
MEASICNGVIRQIDTEKMDRGRPNLIWKESVNRDMKNWCIIKKLALDMRVEAINLCVRTFIFSSFFLLPFYQVFSHSFSFIYLAFYYIFFLF